MESRVNGGCALLKEGFLTKLWRGLINHLQIIKQKEGNYLGFGALSGKMLLLRIVENNKIDAYFKAG